MLNYKPSAQVMRYTSKLSKLELILEVLNYG